MKRRDSLLSQFVEIEVAFGLVNQILSFRPIAPSQGSAPTFANFGNAPGKGMVKVAGIIRSV